MPDFTQTFQKMKPACALLSFLGSDPGGTQANVYLSRILLSNTQKTHIQAIRIRTQVDWDLERDEPNWSNFKLVPSVPYLPRFQ